jgi:hypothetical protein
MFQAQLNEEIDPIAKTMMILQKSPYTLQITQQSCNSFCIYMAQSTAIKGYVCTQQPR